MHRNTVLFDIFRNVGLGGSLKVMRLSQTDRRAEAKTVEGLQISKGGLAKIMYCVLKSKAACAKVV